MQIVKPGDRIVLDTFKIQVVDAYNTREGNSTRKVHHKGDGVGYLLTLEGKTIYHAGDTDVALLPIGGTFTMDIQEAVEAVMVIKPDIAIPIHYKDANPTEFKDKVESRSTTKVVLLKTGEHYRFK